MINKINNISFKSAFVNRDLSNKLSRENYEKVNIAASMVDQLYPQTDVYFYSDKNGNIVYNVQKGDPSKLILDSEVLKKIKMNVKDMANLINLKTYLEFSHNELWGIKKPYLEEKIENIDEMDEFDLACEVNSTILLFNKIHKDTFN